VKQELSNGRLRKEVRKMIKGGLRKMIKGGLRKNGLRKMGWSDEYSMEFDYQLEYAPIILEFEGAYVSPERATFDYPGQPAMVEDFKIRIVGIENNGVFVKTSIDVPRDFFTDEELSMFKDIFIEYVEDLKKR